MSSSLSTPMNFLGNVLDNIQQDPKAAQFPELGVGVAVDALRNTPVDLFSNIPHFQTEVDNSESPALPVGSSGS
jgi:hypothetical protein